MANKKKTKVKPAPKTKAKLVAKPKPKAKMKPKIQSKPKSKSSVKAKAQAKPKPKAQAKPKPKAKTKFTKAIALKTPVKLSPPKNVDYSKAITPLGDRLVIRVTQGERVTAGGLIIPDTVSQATGFLKATVLAVGRGTVSKKGSLKPMDVKIGDSVLFSQHAGMKIKFNAEDLQIIQETDVMGVVQN